MNYLRFTDKMSPEERKEWWKNQTAKEGNDKTLWMDRADIKTATGFSADKRFHTSKGKSWYKQGVLHYGKGIG